MTRPRSNERQADQRSPAGAEMEGADAPALNTRHDAVNGGAAASDESMEELRQRAEAAEKKALVYQADLENFRLRKNREAAEQLKFASLPLIERLLEVVDNLERALESASESSGSGETLVQGVEMVAGQLKSVLEAQGCKRIEAVGVPFDPHVQEAIQMQPAEADPNVIIMEVQPGYKMHERVIRPAKVIVSTGRNPDQSGS